MNQLSKTNTKNVLFFITLFAIMMVVSAMTSQVMAAPPVSGAIFTTDIGCNGTNLNIYNDKTAVYLDGGPAHPGAAGLPDGSYYVQVTDPDGTLRGTSVGSSNPTPVSVVGGEFQVCYQLSSILIKASDQTSGYDNTGNPGGVYKVWVSNDPNFTNNSTKTDNFKVNSNPVSPPPATLDAVKFYDTNANGVKDADEIFITGWKIRIVDGIDIYRFTPVSLVVEPDTYTLTESDTVETNWVNTTPKSVGISVASGETKTAQFGNVCLGAGGGLTLGFWSNRNGQALIGADDLTMLTSLNLRNANGTSFDPGTYNLFRTWLLSATATNMSYMLSAQLSAMKLNVFNNKVNGNALIYAPGTMSGGELGFATVNAVMAEANTELGLHDLVLSDNSFRNYQEALKNALDRGNNNLNFVQANPCAFTFAP